MFYIFWVSFLMSLIMGADLAISPRSFDNQLKGMVFTFFFISTLVSAIQLIL